MWKEFNEQNKPTERGIYYFECQHVEDYSKKRVKAYYFEPNARGIGKWQAEPVHPTPFDKFFIPTHWFDLPKRES
jgi:hypothetical protein